MYVVRASIKGMGDRTRPQFYTNDLNEAREYENRLKRKPEVVVTIITQRENKVMTFKDMLIAQYVRLGEDYEIEVVDNKVSVWNRTDHTSIIYKFDDEGNLLYTL